ISDTLFIRRHYEESLRDPLFMMLRARLENMIMFNVAAEKIEESQSLTSFSLRTLAQHYATCLQLNEPSAKRLIIAFGALLLGAVQVESHGSRQKKQQTSQNTGVLVNELDGQHIFETNALMILEGIRRRMPEQ
ncbi:MAG: hypothetical protein AAF512_22200, partial [Pseudomonadota bacterium]